MGHMKKLALILGVLSLVACTDQKVVNYNTARLDNIEAYYESLPIYTTGKPVKKARTYLGDKNFNDEFEVVENRSSLNKMK